MIWRFASAIGSMNAHSAKYLFDLSPDSSDEPTIGELGLDLFFTNATHEEAPKGISSDQLSKFWKIDLDSSKRTLDVTTQKFKRSDDPNLSRNYSTNYRMLRYKRIGKFSFMDTFFATSKAGKSSRVNTCCQLSVSDKGFVFVVLMKKKSEVPLALKLFAK